MDDLLTRSTEKLAQACSRRHFFSSAGKFALALGLAAVGESVVGTSTAQAAGSQCAYGCNGCANDGACHSPAPPCSNYNYTCPSSGGCPGRATQANCWNCCSNHCLYKCCECCVPWGLDYQPCRCFTNLFSNCGGSGCPHAPAP